MISKKDLIGRINFADFAHAMSSTPKQEKATIPLIIWELQNAGGEMPREQLEQNLAQYDDRLAKYMELIRTSKSGNRYKPWNFTYNFAMKNLELADFARKNRGTPNLTEKGLNVDIDNFNVEKDVYSISNQYWKNKQAEHFTRKRSDNAGVAVGDGESILLDDGFRDKWRDELLEKLRKMNAYNFEKFSRGLIARMGVEIDDELGVAKSGDGGLDGFGYYAGDDFRTTKIGIQCKRYKAGSQVGAGEIDGFIGAVSKKSAQYGIFITTSTFTTAARRSAREGGTTITLIDGEKLIDLICKYHYKVMEFAYFIASDDVIWSSDEN